MVKNWSTRLTPFRDERFGAHSASVRELLGDRHMWKKKRAPEQPTDTSPQKRRSDPDAQERRYGRYDGDLTQGDEGIDDPPEQG